jgi:hypothetical protein
VTQPLPPECPRMKFKSLLCLWLGCVPGFQASRAAEPIQLHPANPHYFLWQSKSTVLITTSEHYGALMNLGFDYLPYLDELKTQNFNLARVFSGTYRELEESFNITANPLAPRRGMFICPWARSETPGASDGGNKFDLTRWDDGYFARAKDFISQAGERGIVVELVLFCTMYDETFWAASPMNARNNINGIGAVDKFNVLNAKDKALLATQVAVVQKIVTELNGLDNLYYEICNEPYERSGLTPEWSDKMAETISATESSLPKKHLIAQGFPPVDEPIKRLNPLVSIVNFHLARAADVRMNYERNKVVAYDETGGGDHADRRYRVEGWDFLLAGGAVYDHLDFSFTIDHPDGSGFPLPDGTPGGGGPSLRHQLSIMKKFMEGFDFVKMKPSDHLITRSQIASEPNADSKEKSSIRVLAEPGKAYALHINGGRQAELQIELPPGRFSAEWIDTKSGQIVKSEKFLHNGGPRTAISPNYQEDIAFRIVAIPGS